AGVWKGSIGAPDGYNFFTVTEVQPCVDAIQAMSGAPFPLDRTKISATVVNGETYLRFPLEKGEQVFGFGLNFQSVHQRGKVLSLHVDHYGDKDNGRSHAPVPLYVSSS